MSDDARRVPLNRIERVLTAMIASVGGLSILSMIIVLIAGLAGLTDFTGGVWPFLRILPVIGLPLVLVLIIAFSITFAVRRRGAAPSGGR